VRRPRLMETVAPEELPLLSFRDAYEKSTGNDG
jgi:hypothetical protein